MCYSEDTMEIKNIPLSQIRRPLPRQTDPEKVNQLMQSIAEEGLREPMFWRWMVTTTVFPVAIALPLISVSVKKQFSVEFVAPLNPF